MNSFTTIAQETVAVADTTRPVPAPAMPEAEDRIA